MAAVLAVPSAEFQAAVRRAPFLALPREEIERLHGAIEVLAVDDATLRERTEFLALHSDVAIHHNYTWLTFRGRDDQRTLLLSSTVAAAGPVPLFLGAEFVAAAQRQVAERLDLKTGFEVRVAGILQEAGSPQATPRVSLLSVARLAGRTPTPGAEYFGRVELLQTRTQFDPRSQVVIDYLDAL